MNKRYFCHVSLLLEIESRISQKPWHLCTKELSNPFQDTNKCYKVAPQLPIQVSEV